MIAERGRLMSELPVGGRMVAVMASEAKVRSAMGVAGIESVAVAAVNGPEAVVVSGEAEAVSAVVSSLGVGVRSKALSVSHAFHSPLMEAMTAEFRSAVDRVALSSGSVPVVSNVSGKVAVEGEMTCAEYWCEHVMQPVRFMDGMRTMEGLGCDCYLEVGPQGVLTRMARKCVLDSSNPVWMLSMPVRRAPPCMRSTVLALTGFAQVLERSLALRQPETLF